VIAFSESLPYLFGVIHDTFWPQGKNFNLEILLIHFGDSFIVIKKDKIDLMVKRSTIERKVYLHTHTTSDEDDGSSNDDVARVCRCEQKRKQKQTDAYN
jgi:hypothetical protein